MDLAPGLTAATAPGGTLVLSGVIESKEPAVRRTFDALGMVFDRRTQMDDWVALVYRRPAFN
jgi:ribosomal protein L11 methyltransferase